MLALFSNCAGRFAAMSVFRRIWRSATQTNLNNSKRKKQLDQEAEEEEEKNRKNGGRSELLPENQRRPPTKTTTIEKKTAKKTMMQQQHQKHQQSSLIDEGAKATTFGDHQKQQQRQCSLHLQKKKQQQQQQPPVLIRIEGTEEVFRNDAAATAATRIGGGSERRHEVGEENGGGTVTDRSADQCTSSGGNNPNNAANTAVAVDDRRDRRRKTSHEQLLGSFTSIELRTESGSSGGPNHPIANDAVDNHHHHQFAVASHSTAAGAALTPSPHRPCSSGEIELQQTCLGQPCARMRLSVLYSDQKRLLILTLHELAQTDEEVLDGRTASPLAFQIRLALLTDGQQPDAKVQKFQSKFHALDQFQEVNYGQTFAFHCPRDQLAGSVVRFRLYRKCKGHQHRPQCRGTAFLRNYLVDADAHRAQNHFLQFRRNLMEQSKSKAKGSLSLFPSLLSLATHHHQPHHQSQTVQQQQQSSSTKSSISISGTPPPAPPPPPQQPLPLNIPAPATSYHHQQQQQQSSLPMTPQSASSSRRGSTVDVESGRFCSLPQFGSNQPEVLVSLCYFDAQNRLVVGVDKVAALAGNVVSRFGSNKEEAEFFVRISALSSNGTERGKQKSECVRPNGVGETPFNVQAAFHVPRAELAQCSVLVQLYAVHGNASWPLMLRRKQRIGTLTLGGEQQQQPHSGQANDAQMHWQEMIQGMGLTVDKWHLLTLTTTTPTMEAERNNNSTNNAAGSGKLFGGTNFLDPNGGGK